MKLMSTRELITPKRTSSAEATTLIEGRHGHHIRVRAGRRQAHTHLHYFNKRSEAEAFAAAIIASDYEGVHVEVNKAGYQYLVSIEDLAGHYTRAAL